MNKKKSLRRNNKAPRFAPLWHFMLFIQAALKGAACAVKAPRNSLKRRRFSEKHGRFSQKRGRFSLKRGTFFAKRRRLSSVIYRLHPVLLTKTQDLSSKNTRLVLKGTRLVHKGNDQKRVVTLPFSFWNNKDCIYQHFLTRILSLSPHFLPYIIGGNHPKWKLFSMLSQFCYKTRNSLTCTIFHPFSAKIPRKHTKSTPKPT